MIDLGIAAVMATGVVVLTAGVALAGAVAVIVLLACGVTLVIDRRRARAAPRTARRRAR